MDNINLQRIEGYTVQLVAEDVWAIDELSLIHISWAAQLLPTDIWQWLLLWKNI